ncbi:MAG: hypothetical protein P8M49_03290 [Thalassotalea sp.]|nr:hypothetical protein [Thalassotalea sp.]MDG2392511.1 hypothetical protein [Thalassotalea sp.]
MSYTYKGKVYSITTPVERISVNKLNVVVKDKNGSQLFEFTDLNESKGFLESVYQA